MQSKHDFAVDFALKPVAGTCRTKVTVVVDLPVHHGHGTVRAHNGLGSALEVQNGQPRVGQAHTLVRPNAFTVRAAMALETVDAPEHRLIRGTKHSA